MRLLSVERAREFGGDQLTVDRMCVSEYVQSVSNLDFSKKKKKVLDDEHNTIAKQSNKHMQQKRKYQSSFPLFPRLSAWSTFTVSIKLLDMICQIRSANLNRPSRTTKGCSRTRSAKKRCV